MKTKITSSIVLFSLFCGTVFWGCKKKEKDTAANFTNADYAGTWNVTDGCCSGSFQITIAASGSDGVTITNFRKCAAAAGWNLTGTVSGATLTIPAQNVVSSTQGGPYKFSGTGTLNSTSSLSIPYTMADAAGNYPQSCTATCTK
ncbi:MAG: hypothetical protein EPN85_03520 [Bacteroidetes bacterium]|nr:MAG: hypothetical protein EPN85_03520 [Bacteroidota bacterium]